MSKKLFSLVMLASMIVSGSCFAATPAASTSTRAAVVEQAKPSVVTRAVESVKSGVKSATNCVTCAATRSASAVSAAAASVYAFTWIQHRYLTCLAAAILASGLAYNYNDAFRQAVNQFLGLDDESCRFCPKSCADQN